MRVGGVVGGLPRLMVRRDDMASRAVLGLLLLMFDPHGSTGPGGGDDSREDGERYESELQRSTHMLTHARGDSSAVHFPARRPEVNAHPIFTPWPVPLTSRLPWPISPAA